MTPGLPDLHHLHVAACAEEGRLWAQVRGRHPGQPGHDPEAWNEWVEATRRVHAIGRRLQPTHAQRVRTTVPWG